LIKEIDCLFCKKIKIITPIISYLALALALSLSLSLVLPFPTALSY